MPAGSRRRGRAHTTADARLAKLAGIPVSDDFAISWHLLDHGCLHLNSRCTLPLGSCDVTNQCKNEVRIFLWHWAHSLSLFFVSSNFVSHG